MQTQRLFAVQFRVCTKLLNSPWKELFFFRSNTLQNLQRFTFPEFVKPWDGLAFVSFCTFIYIWNIVFPCIQDYQFSNFLNLTFQEFTRRPWVGLALVQFVLLCTPGLHQKYFSIAMETSHWLFIYTTASTPRKLLRDVVWRDRGCFISERSLQNGAVPGVTIVVTTNNIWCYKNELDAFHFWWSSRGWGSWLF